MKNKYLIHQDFKKLPVINLYFNKLLVILINCMLKIHRGMIKKSDKVERQRYKIDSLDDRKFYVNLIKLRGISKKLPAIVYYHGGAFALTYMALHVKNVEQYAIEAQCCVILVDYRLSHLHPFPIGLEDCYAALRWTVHNAEELNIDRDKILVMGDSAGGALATSVAQMAVDKNEINICAQALIYPVTDCECKTSSATEFFDTPLWTVKSSKNMWNTYLRNCKNGKIPQYSSPIHGSNLSKLPSTYIETAEFDPLRDEALQYAGLLMKEGVDVSMNKTLGTVHGFDLIAKSEITKRAMAQRIQFIKDNT